MKSIFIWMFMESIIPYNINGSWNIESHFHKPAYIYMNASFLLRVYATIQNGVYSYIVHIQVYPSWNLILGFNISSYIIE